MLERIDGFEAVADEVGADVEEVDDVVHCDNVKVVVVDDEDARVVTLIIMHLVCVLDELEEGAFIEICLRLGFLAEIH